MGANGQQGLGAAVDRARGLFGFEPTGPLPGAARPAGESAAAAYYRAAQHRIEAGDRLVDVRQAVAALRLYREGFLLLAAAIAAAHEQAADPETTAGPDAVATLTRLAGAGRIPPLPAPVEQAIQRLGAASLLGFDGATPDEIWRDRDAARAALRWLRRLVEPQVEPWTPRDRLLIWGGGVVVAAAAALLLMPARHGLRNIALEHPVTISERHPDSKAPADNSGLVNGVIESTYGVETSRRDAWVAVHLTWVHEITRVKVYNRADGWFDEGLPLTMEMSEDGRKFTEVDRRTTPFTSTSPWVYDAGGRHASVVRIRSPSYVALTEIEVYERE